jgi:uncharacterized membrane protein YbaN (DUF454 family)
MIRFVLIALGTIFLALGVVGAVVPGLPTTPFLLLSAACYVRSSQRLYTWLLNQKVFGKIIRDFRETRSISLRSKVISIASMWAMILLSIFIFIENLAVEITISALGAAGTLALLLIPTSKKRRKGFE